MKQLIVYSHPNPASFCNALKEKVVETYASIGHEVIVRDLYSIGFDPVLKGSDFAGLQSGNLPEDIKTEQGYIRDADVINMIYPIWWTGLPAMIKGYIDRVFLYGFAYSLDENYNIQQLLKGKRALIINTMGTPNEVYEQSGAIEAMKLTSDRGIFEFCGIEVLAHKFFGAVPMIDDAARKAMLEETASLIRTTIMA